MAAMSLKEIGLALAARTGLAALAKRATARRLRVLCYHGIWVTPGIEFGDTLFIAPEQFERRMERLKRSGYPVLPLAEAVERLGRDTLPDNAVAITIDDGWASTLTHMLPVLETHGFPATLYVTSWYAGRDLPVVQPAVRYLAAASGRSGIDHAAAARRIDSLPLGERLGALRRFGAEMGVPESWLALRQFHILSAAELAEARRRGLDLQLHTHRHIDLDEGAETLACEIRENRAFLAAAVGAGRFDHFCFPSGSWHPDAPAILSACGIRSATGCEQGLNAPGADPLSLRRLLDGRSVGDAVFDAYLSGLLEWTAPRPRRQPIAGVPATAPAAAPLRAPQPEGAWPC